MQLKLSDDVNLFTLWERRERCITCNSKQSGNDPSKALKVIKNGCELRVKKKGSTSRRDSPNGNVSNFFPFFKARVSHRLVNEKSVMMAHEGESHDACCWEYVGLGELVSVSWSWTVRKKTSHWILCVKLNEPLLFGWIGNCCSAVKNTYFSTTHSTILMQLFYKK